MDLRCRKTNCKYNKNLTCLANKIEIENKLSCKTFVNCKSKEEIDFSSQIFSQNPPEIADYRHLKNICLNCQAKCLFNKNNHCIANGITINPSKQNIPKCITFMKP